MDQAQLNVDLSALNSDDDKKKPRINFYDKFVKEISPMFQTCYSKSAICCFDQCLSRNIRVANECAPIVFKLIGPSNSHLVG